MSSEEHDIDHTVSDAEADGAAEAAEGHANTGLTDEGPDSKDPGADEQDADDSAETAPKKTPTKKAAGSKTAGSKTGSKTAAGKTAAKKAVEPDDEFSDVDDEPTSEPDTAGESRSGRSSGVAAKAKARADRDRESAGGGREFTVSARALTRAAAVVVGLALVAALAFGGWKLYEKNARLAAFADSKAAASEFVTTYFGVTMGQNPTSDALRSQVGPLTTDGLRARLDKEADTMISAVKESKIANVETKVNASMVESFDTENAVTVLAIEFSGTSAVAPGGGRSAYLLQLTMRKVDGKWLVAEMGMVPGMQAGSLDGAGTVPGQPGPTPTPAPTPAPGG